MLLAYSLAVRFRSNRQEWNREREDRVERCLVSACLVLSVAFGVLYYWRNAKLINTPPFIFQGGLMAGTLVTGTPVLAVIFEFIVNEVRDRTDKTRIMKSKRAEKTLENIDSVQGVKMFVDFYGIDIERKDGFEKSEIEYLKKYFSKPFTTTLEIYNSGNEEEAETCCICSEEFKSDNKVIQLPECLHRFGDECLSTWLRQRGTCPLCK